MKRKHLILATLLLVAATARAYWVFQGNLVNGVISANTNYVLDLNSLPNVQTGMTYVSAQAVYSENSPSATNFTDGSAATATITVASNVALSSASAVDQITVAPTATILGQAATGQMTIVSNSTQPVTVYVNGNTLTRGVDWLNGVASSNTAVNLAAAVNHVGGVRANAVGSVIYSTASVVGIGGNSYTLATSASGQVSVSAANYSGGRAPPLINAYLTLNGQILKQGYQWTAQTTSSATATSIAHVINLLSGVHASAVGSVVYTTATYGLAGNSYTLTSSSPSFLTVANPTFTGGRDNAAITISGVALTQGTNWVVGNTSSNTATNIAAAINASSGLTSLVHAAAASTIVYSTATKVGTGTNYSILSSTPTALVLAHATYVGGTNADYTFNAGTINKTVTYGIGMPLLYTSGTVLHPLSTGTTYFATLVTPSSFGLATTSTGAVAGAFITFTSSSTQTPAHTFTLTPTAYAGTAAFAWFASNDGVNYNSIGGPTIYYGSPSTNSTSQLWDFGQVNYRYLQLQTTAPTSGGLNLVVTVKGGN